MRCKECREKIPDSTKKYCPECGAIVNNIKHTTDNTKKYAPQIQQKSYEDFYGDNKPAKKQSTPFLKKKQEKQALAICIGIAIFVLFIIFMNDESTYEDTFTEEENEVIFDNTFTDDFLESETASEMLTL